MKYRMPICPNDTVAALALDEMEEMAERFDAQARLLRNLHAAGVPLVEEESVDGEVTILWAETEDEAVAADKRFQFEKAEDW